MVSISVCWNLNDRNIRNLNGGNKGNKKILHGKNLFKKTKKCDNALKNYSLDHLAHVYDIEKHDRHTSQGDAYITGLLFLKILAELNERDHLTLSEILYSKLNTQNYF